VDEATVDQLTGLIREIARQVLAGSMAVTDKADKKPNRPKKSATVLPIRPA